MVYYYNIYGNNVSLRVKNFNTLYYKTDIIFLVRFMFNENPLTVKSVIKS